MLLTKKQLGRKQTLLLQKLGITGNQLDKALARFNSTTNNDQYKTAGYFIKYCLDQKKKIQGLQASVQQQMTIHWQPSRDCVQTLISEHYLEELIHFEIDAFIIAVRETMIPIDLDASFKAWVRRRLTKMTAATTLKEWLGTKPLRPGSVLNRYSNNLGIKPRIIKECLTLYCKSKSMDHNDCHDRRIIALLSKRFNKNDKNTA